MTEQMKLPSLTAPKDENDFEFQYQAKVPNRISTEERLPVYSDKRDGGRLAKPAPGRKDSAENTNLWATDEEYGWNQYNHGLSIQWFTLMADNLLSHPFIVLQRQCQVFSESKKYHLGPISLIPSIINLLKRQKFTTLWKGLGSCLVVRGMTAAIEDLMNKLLSWPKDLHSRNSFKEFGEHIFLKWQAYIFIRINFIINFSISIAFVTPFVCVSLVETVQSDIASEKTSLFDFFREGFQRILCWTKPKRGRIIPLWILIGPSIFSGLGKYMLRLMIKGVFSCMKYQIEGIFWKDNEPKRIMHLNHFEIYSNLFSVMFSNVVFYPFETILYRLQLQGTRTIIDNLDTGCSVVPILTSYRGAINCYRATLSSEGVRGLYKGFGAVILQFLVQIAIIKVSIWSSTQITNMVSHTASCENPY